MPLLQPGLSIGSAEGIKGTLALLVRKVDEAAGSVYGLSCAHVLATLTIDLPKNDKYSLSEAWRSVKQPWLNSESLVSGEFRVGRLCNEFSIISKTVVNRSDEALFVVDGTASIEMQANIFKIGKPRDWCRDVRFGADVHLMGAGSQQVVEGHVLRRDQQTPSEELVVRLPRFGLLDFRYSGLIRYRAATMPGDSGAVILEQSTNDVVGIHVAGRGAHEALFYPIHEIFNRLNLDLYRG